MIVLDFETYSPVPIDYGIEQYTMHPEADIVCMAYKEDDKPVKVWVPGGPVPEFHGHALYAHNAIFDFCVWNRLGDRYGFRETQLTDWRCSMALARRYSLPGALDKVGAILNLKVQKDPRGKALIKKICNPTSPFSTRPILGRDFTSVDLIDFIDYCKTDVESTYEVITSLPSLTLSDYEQALWVLTETMNLRGLPVDEMTASLILEYIGSYVYEATRRVPEITEGAIMKATQAVKIVRYIKSHGIDIPNLQAPTVEAFLKRPLPPHIKELLELRQEIGQSSTAKYKKIEELKFEGRVCHNLVYCGAEKTGRWAGKGLQIHNLPRAKVENPEEYIEKFHAFQPIEDPLFVAKALIRPMIKAPEGKSLIVSDYSSIENYLLMWLAGEREALERLRQGKDQYKEMASFLYNLSEEQINSLQRLVGKIIILGCGYGMGEERFQETAADWGVDLSKPESKAAVDAYRTKYALVVKLWYALKNIVVYAVRNPGKVFEYNGVRARVTKCRAQNKWLVLTLPSGRNLFYKDPYVEADSRGWAPGHYGTHPKTKQWVRLRLIPGRITENIIQALARDCMAAGLLNVERYMPEVKLLGTVHDEAIGEIWDCDINSTTLTTFNEQLCSLPEWGQSIPLKAEGYIEKRYRK